MPVVQIQGLKIFKLSATQFPTQTRKATHTRPASIRVFCPRTNAPPLRPFPNPAVAPDLPPSFPHPDRRLRSTFELAIPNSHMALLITGALVSPIDRRSCKVIPSARIYVGHDGIIKAIDEIPVGVAPTTPATPDAFLEAVGHTGDLERLHLARGEFLIPGFIDTHTVRALHRHICALPNV